MGRDERRAMENGGGRREIENGAETIRRFASELVMCSTCSGFVFRKKRSAVDPDEDEEAVEVVREAEEVVEVVREAGKMRDLMQAVFLHGPLQEKEPAQATKEQWQVLRTRRLIMMETKRCPACSRSLINMCPTCSRQLSEKPGIHEDDKATGSKEKKNSLMEEVSELVAILASEDEATVANTRSVKKSKRSREEKKAKRSREKKAKRSSETEGSGSWEEPNMEVSESSSRNGKTKMLTRRMDKKSIDILKYHPPVKPFTLSDDEMQMFDSPIAQYEIAAKYEVDCEFHEYLQRQSLIRGYAEYQVEVTDDEDE